MKKVVDLEITHDWDGIISLAPELDKKAASSQKKLMKDLRERHPIEISVSFKLPWWCIEAEAE